MAHSSGSSVSLKSGLIDFTAGSLGGVAVVYVGQPLDTVKVKMQTFPHLYKGMYDCVKQTLRNDGFVRGLYAGTTPAIVANVAENSVLFAAYGYCQKFVCTLTGTERVEQLSTLDNAWAGCLAALFSSFTLCPTELVKCQLQAMREISVHTDNSAVRMSPLQLTAQIVREGGVAGLFRGLVPTILREMPGYFFFFGGYEGTRSLLTAPGQRKEDIGFVRTMVAGAVGGVVLWTVIFPTDVIKSRVQVASNASANQGFLQVGVDIVKNEGVLALYNGLKPTLVRTVPATAALFLVYEYSKKLMTQAFGD